MSHDIILEEHVEDLGDIGYVEAPWDEALQLLQKQDYAAPISARDLAFACVQTGNLNSLFKQGSYIKESILYSPNQNHLLISASSILDNAKKATQAHRNKKEYSPLQNTIERFWCEAREDCGKYPQKRRVLTLGYRQTYDIPTTRFDEDELTLFLFKDQARLYGSFLDEHGIKKMFFHLEDVPHASQNSFERPLWLHHLSGRSLLSGCGVLDFGVRVRGVRRGATITDEEYLQNSSELSLRNTHKALDALNPPKTRAGLLPILIHQIGRKYQ